MVLRIWSVGSRPQNIDSISGCFGTGWIHLGQYIFANWFPRVAKGLTCFRLYGVLIFMRNSTMDLRRLSALFLQLPSLLSEWVEVSYLYCRFRLLRSFSSSSCCSYSPLLSSTRSVPNQVFLMSLTFVFSSYWIVLLCFMRTNSVWEVFLFNSLFFFGCCFWFIFVQQNSFLRFCLFCIFSFNFLPHIRFLV